MENTRKWSDELNAYVNRNEYRKGAEIFAGTEV